jgi:hypothetical protein
LAADESQNGLQPSVILDTISFSKPSVILDTISFNCILASFGTQSSAHHFHPNQSNLVSTTGTATTTTDLTLLIGVAPREYRFGTQATKLVESTTSRMYCIVGRAKTWLIGVVCRCPSSWSVSRANKTL